MKIFLRSAYNYDVDEASRASALACDDPSLAQQSFKDECDLNVLMERFGQGYQVPPGVVAPSFGDFTGATNYHDMMNVIAVANEAFDLLPAAVRERFVNDPGQFVAFCSDEANRAELDKLGLLEPRAPGALLSGGVPPPPHDRVPPLYPPPGGPAGPVPGSAPSPAVSAAPAASGPSTT